MIGGVFECLKAELLNNGFVKTNSEHRLKSPDNTMIDIIPFGEIADSYSNIKWPPKGAFEMNVLGFQEAYAHALQVVIQENPLFKIPVVSPKGMVLLKLISWSERGINLRKKDARDFVYILENYKHVSDISERIYDEVDMEKYNWEISLASAHILGYDSAVIAKIQTKNKIIQILNDNLKFDTGNKLVEEMCNDIEKEYQEKFELLQAFKNGFVSVQS